MSISNLMYNTFNKRIYNTLFKNDNSFLKFSFRRNVCSFTKTDFSRTSTTSRLWAKRAEILRKELDSNILSKPQDSTVEEIEPFILVKKPSDSYLEIHYPFTTDDNLRDEYINIHGNIRFGKILEDLDAMAGNIAHLHADDNNPSTRPLNIVTASLDRIDLLSKMEINNDMKMSGCVSYAGRSSIEVRIDLESFDKTNNRWQPLLLATFTMVALSNGKPVPINKIKPETEIEKQLYLFGEENSIRRKENAKRSLNLMPPTEEEVLITHNLHLSYSKCKEQFVKMSETKRQSVILMQPQERNTAGKIFGGYLMRQAYELAWTTGHLFSQVRPFFLASDNVSFNKPVEIGSIAIFNAQVVYTEDDKAFTVRVDTDVVNPIDNTETRTNTFFFTFTCPEKPIKTIVPNTYHETMLWIEGRRKFIEGRDIAKSLESRLLRFY